MVEEINHLIEHSFTVEEARKLQRKIAAKVVERDEFSKPVRLVAGLDVGYLGDNAFAAAVVLDYEDLKTVEKKTVTSRVRFPYVSTLLSFREIEPLAKAIEKLATQPDVYLVDAQGIAHPYFCGCASHLGVVLDITTIGVAKSKLVGSYEEPANRKGKWSPLTYRERTVGAVLRTKAGSRPLFISVGHRVSLETAIKIALKSTGNYKLPEPTRLAHLEAKKAKLEGGEKGQNPIPKLF